MSTVILIPVLWRPHRVAPLLANIAAATPEEHSVLFVCTSTDREEQVAITEAGGEFIVVRSDGERRGDYARKINLGYRNTTHPFMFLGADDLNFHPGWLTAALALMSDSVGVVGTQDLGNTRVRRGEHSTHSLVARWYVDRFGTIDERRKVLCEQYPHEFVDDEFVQTAVRRGAFAFAHDAVVEHMHPNWGKSESDRLYAQEPRRMAIGRRIYTRRKKLWT